jgi:hypothetical protein
LTGAESAGRAVVEVQEARVREHDIFHALVALGLFLPGQRAFMGFDGRSVENALNGFCWLV